MEDAKIDPAFRPEDRSMAEPKVQACPTCNGTSIKFFPSYGGKHGDLTAYIAECPCGVKLDDLSHDGTKRGAIRDWNRWAKAEKAKRHATGVPANPHQGIPPHTPMLGGEGEG